MNGERLRIGIVGCGDVAHRHYLPGLASMSDAVMVAAVADPRVGALIGADPVDERLGLGVGSAVNQTLQPGVHDGTGAHYTGFERYIEFAFR